MIKRFICWLRTGHQFMRAFDRKRQRLYLRCAECQHETTGWTIVARSRAVIALAFALMTAAPAFAEPIFSNGVDTFWSREPFTVRAFHAPVVEPGMVLEGEFGPFVWRHEGGWHIAQAMNLPTCGKLQLDAYRDDWGDLAFVLQAFDNCAPVDPPVGPPIDPPVTPPQSVPEPAALALAVLGVVLAWWVRGAR